MDDAATPQMGPPPDPVVAPASGVSVEPSNAALTQYEQVYLRYDGSDVWVRVG